MWSNLAQYVPNLTQLQILKNKFKLYNTAVQYCSTAGGGGVDTGLGQCTVQDIGLVCTLYSVIRIPYINLSCCTLVHCLVYSCSVHCTLCNSTLEGSVYTLNPTVSLYTVLYPQRTENHNLPKFRVFCAFILMGAKRQKCVNKLYLVSSTASFA